MNFLSVPRRLAVVALGVTLLGVAGWVRASVQTPGPKDGDEDGDTTSAGTLSAPSVRPGTTGTGTYNFNGGTLSTATGATFTSLSGGTLTLNGGNTYSGSRLVKEVVAAALTGSAGDLKITETPDGSNLRVKTIVAVTNTGKKAAKDVLATVYLSDDAVLDTAKDTRLATLKLADYVPDFTKLRKGETLSIPVKHKAPTAAASFLEGKYLIVVLTGETTAMVETGGDVATFRPGTSEISSGTLFVNQPPLATNPLAGTVTTISTGTGTVVYTGNSGFLQNPTTVTLQNLTATAINTFQVDAPFSATDPAATVSGGTLTSAGIVQNVLTGSPQTAQPGDVLSIAQGFELHAVTEGDWTLPSGAALKIAANATLLNATGMPIATSTPTPTPTATPTPTPTPAATPAATPAPNEVIIGPIHLP